MPNAGNREWTICVPKGFEHFLYIRYCSVYYQIYSQNGFAASSSLRFNFVRVANKGIYRLFNFCEFIKIKIESNFA